MALERFYKEFSVVYLKYTEERKKRKRMIKALKVHIKKELKVSDMLAEKISIF